MATKQVDINSSVMPSINIPAAEAMLGKVVEPPKTRWSPGQLLGQAMNLTTAPVVAVLTPFSLVILGFGSAVQAYDAVAAAVAASAQTACLSGLATDPGNGSLRSRVVDLSGMGWDYTPPTIDADPAFTADIRNLASALSIPARPVFTGASLASKVDSFFQDRENPAEFVMAIDQFNGRFFVTSAPSSLEAVLAAITGANGASIIAAFDLSIPDGAVVTPETGPIFG